MKCQYLVFIMFSRYFISEQYIFYNLVLIKTECNRKLIVSYPFLFKWMFKNDASQVMWYWS